MTGESTTFDITVSGRTWWRLTTLAEQAGQRLVEWLDQIAAGVTVAEYVPEPEPDPETVKPIGGSIRQIDDDEATRLYYTGRKASDIATRLGVSAPTVYRALRRTGAMS